MDVLITGANGRVGTAITDHLGDDDQYSFTRMDIQPRAPEDDDTIIADAGEYDAIRPHFTGQDAVIHLAIPNEMMRPGTTEITWTDALGATLRGITNVYEAAIDAGLEKILFASSNHAVGMIEVQHKPEIYYDQGIVAGHNEPHRPDSPYGVTKTYGEDLGRLAAEANDIAFYGLRIGAVRPEAYDHPYGDAERGVEEGSWERDSSEYDEQVARLKGLWQSRRDLAHFVECCLQDDTVTWDHFYGVSANDRRWLDDLAYANETIGYEPQDNGDDWTEPPD